MNHFNSIDTVMAFVAEKLPPVIAAPPAYPFIGEKAVRAALQSDYDLQEAVLVMLYHLQTQDEQATRDTKTKNRAGFMSSDAFHGTRIAEALVLGLCLEHEDIERVQRIATKYAKQTTVQLRRVAMQQDARLAAYATVFSIK
jgi:hypothetical protein